MKGGDYAPGAFCSAHSINRVKSKNINTVIMVTPEVPKEAITALSFVCDYIVVVDEIKHPTKGMKTEKQKELYSSWIDSSYSKWNCLRLPFDKVLLLDADIVAIGNIDSLFQLNTPAAPFASAFAKPLGKIRNEFSTKHNVGADGYPRHNSKITYSSIVKSYYYKTTLCFATTILLSPSVTEFNNFIKMLKIEFPEEFGFDVNSGADEQSILYYYSISKHGPKVEWTNIHHKYNFHTWKINGYLKPNVTPYVLHFMSQPKPWKLKVTDWPDLVNWYILFLDGLLHYPETVNYFKPVCKNVDPKETKNITLLLIECFQLDQTYIKSISLPYKNIVSCLDLKKYLN